MADLRGRTLVSLEGRMSSELTALIERHGGRPINAPAVRDAPVTERPEVSSFIDAICDGKVEAIVFQTGVGAKALISAAEEAGRKDDLLKALQAMKVVCRGPKPLSVLKSNNIRIDLAVPAPYTSETLIEVLKVLDWDLKGKRVALQHYGEVNTFLKNELSAMGADVIEVSLYRWELPVDTIPLEDAIGRMVREEADAVLFTSQVQVRHMFLIADRIGLTGPLKKALRTKVAVAAVGPVCVRALTEEGIAPDIVPEHPKLGHLVLAVADYFDKSNPGNLKASTIILAQERESS